MKLTFNILFITTLLSFSVVNAQDFQGVATYKSHRKFDMKNDDGKIGSEMQKNLEEQLRKQFQQEYTLNFTRNESTYKQNEKLEAPMPSNGGITITVANGSDIIYKNIKERRFTNQTEIYGKQFLIKDTLEDRKWELLNETKNIGEYTCFKAQLKTEVKTQGLNEDNAVETIMKEIITTAWYTPQIPVSNGPGAFFGLPGLILEINEGKLTLACSKIVINPTEVISIDEPKKGKQVTQQDFDDIREKKMKEMMEHSGTRTKSGGAIIMSSGG